MYQLDYRDYYDRVYAAWKGKCIGGITGAYFENHKEFKYLKESELWPEVVPPNDDLDLQLLWLDALREKGLYLTSQDLIDIWQERCRYNFCEYGFFLLNVQRGIMPPLSGSWNNEFFRESEGCPIRSDIWGMIAPGNPQLAAEYAKMDAELDHCGFSVDAEMFLAAMTAQAIVAKNREEIFEAGLSVLPENSKVREVFAKVCEIHEKISDIKQAWRCIIRHYGDRDASKAITNLAIVLLAWLKSENDLVKALYYCSCMGYDADCTAGTLAALLGAWRGSKCFPVEWSEKATENIVCWIAVRHKNSTLSEVAVDTALLGLEMSMSRNDLCKFTNAPKCENIRTAPGKKLRWSVKYADDEPVLYAEKSTDITLILTNYTAKNFYGSIKLDLPDNIITTSEIPHNLAIKVGESKAITLSFRRKNPQAPLPDKNLFTITFEADDGTICREIFGLNGARQYLLYGPYWSVYDKEKYDSCPFSGEGKNQNPAAVGCCGDAYFHYQYHDEEYLDEKRLSKEDILEEVPMYLESGVDLLSGDDFGRYHGSGCWYLSRTFSIPEGVRVCIHLGRTGALKVWLDGELAADCPKYHNYSASETDRMFFTATGKKQRIVIKLTSPGDERFLAMYFQHVDHDKVRGISYLLDSMTDYVPQNYVDFK
ncbi:MAG: ADP-ribosylglycohydrolase family protein [Lentisphaeria bacterium]|nr:ADP-ribosylglycohydrolase family protein [Lentisphaeria bacterium]